MSHDSMCYVRGEFCIVLLRAGIEVLREASQTQAAEQSCAHVQTTVEGGHGKQSQTSEHESGGKLELG